MTMTWKGEGFTRYISSLQAVIKPTTLLTAQQIAASARSKVPTDTESLLDTIDVEEMPSPTPAHAAASVNAGNTGGGYKGGSTYNDKEQGTPVNYAAEVEYDEKPYMTPAAEAGRQKFLDNMTKAIKGITV